MSMQAFNADSDDSESQSEYMLKVEEISYSSSVQSIVDIEYLQNTYDSEWGRPLD